jgi:hypothetical protein
MGFIFKNSIYGLQEFSPSFGTEEIMQTTGNILYPYQYERVEQGLQEISVRVVFVTFCYLVNLADHKVNIGFFYDQPVSF